MILMIIILTLLLIFLASQRPGHSYLSQFEMQRRIDNKDSEAMEEWRRQDLRKDVLAVRRVLIAALLVIISVLLVREFGWLLGLTTALLISLFYHRIAMLDAVHQVTCKWYEKLEPRFLGVVERSHSFVKLFRDNLDTSQEAQVQSREEIEHVIDQATGLLSKNEMTMIKSMLAFEPRLVRDHMTPRSMMEAIGAHEMLGPLVLDGLHKTGHSHFPVFDGDIDHIVGMLHIHTLLALDHRKSQTVKDAMEPRVLYIHEEQTLDQALSACIKHRRHLLVAINEFRETVGVITIEDAVEQLIGRKILDELDQHDDLRKVAARNPRGNNKTTKGIDV